MHGKSIAGWCQRYHQSLLISSHTTSCPLANSVSLSHSIPFEIQFKLHLQYQLGGNMAIIVLQYHFTVTSVLFL